MSLMFAEVLKSLLTAEALRSLIPVTAEAEKSPLDLPVLSH